MDATTESKDYVSSATLIVTGHDLDPDFVSHLLNLSPSQCWRRGEKETLPGGREHIYKWGGWKLSLNDSEMQQPLEQQLKGWVETLSSKAFQIQQLKQSGAETVLDCFISSNNTATVQLNPELLSEIASTGVGLSLSYFSDGERD